MQLGQLIHSNATLIGYLDCNSWLKLLDLKGPINLFQIIKNWRSKGFVNNPFMTCKFITFATPVKYAKALPCSYWINCWTALCLKSCCIYHRLIRVYKRILSLLQHLLDFWFLSPAFGSVFFLYIFITSSIIQSIISWIRSSSDISLNFS